MKKSKKIGIVCAFVYLSIIVLICVCIIMPGINILNDANNIKELTYDEKTKLIDEINNRYLNLEKEVIGKYNPNIEDINNKYNNIETTIKDKYDKLEQEIKSKYDKKEKELSNQINDNKVLQNKEFFANGLSKKYYELSDKSLELSKEKSQLSFKEREEISNNEKLENNEIKTNNSNKKNELNTIENNKNDELTRLNEKKTSEVNSINNRKSNKDELRNDGIKKIAIGSILILIPLVYIMIVFNKLIHLSNSVKEKWSQVDVYLKQRADLIPNIVETVKGYSTHEKSTLTKITKARTQVINASTKEEEINANKNLENAVGRLFALQEDYPELKANTNFMSLQQNLKEIEDNISLSRQEYNTSVLKYKNKLEMFPSNIIASLFNFKPELFFEINDTEKNNINIDFE